MRFRKQPVGIDALSNRFSSMPYLVEDFKFYVNTMAHYVHEEGADLERAKRLFAEKLSSDHVINAMKRYPESSKETRTIFWEIAELCYSSTSMLDIKNMNTEDEAFERLITAVGGLHNNPGSAHMQLRRAAKWNGDVKVRGADRPAPLRYDI